MRSFKLLVAGAVVAVPLSISLAPVGVGASQPPANQAVTVTNFPATQNVTGTVNVGNFPAFPTTQAVSGTVNVGNFPAFPTTQAVSGTVGVNSLPPISGTVATHPDIPPHAFNLRFLGGSGGNFSNNIGVDGPIADGVRVAITDVVITSAQTLVTTPTRVIIYGSPSANSVGVVNPNPTCDPSYEDTVAVPGNTMLADLVVSPNSTTSEHYTVPDFEPAPQNTNIFNRSWPCLFAIAPGVSGISIQISGYEFGP
jgi:hypothetical protein